jgi:hypothetical protein
MAVAQLRSTPLAASDRLSARILAACREAETKGFRIVSAFRGLVIRDGVLAPADPGRPACLPLEGVVLGCRSTGFFEVDIARALGVSCAWVEGFLHGFALRKAVDAKREGYRAGMAFRERYYPPAAH